ncbi:hydantoinase B/oxoprolinase family protein [Draconibacterium sp. IB214405]|uniref:hydantoinase B/oxoprolinase family protein n=1 Tax=Draconibacterium sp. IB214405 TaxID=3097352 RepID=UPI002A0F7160|nr:hydantoinase B/oxoprolinase family protein [Draconibacterium sp. IB214405]MDX8340963.1 hydantoinase B/oxoprolinase family protein [Draconibacterium sp. IB214405]
MANKYFQLFVDTGGTFTDCIGIDESGQEYRQKVLSSSNLRSTIQKVISANQCVIADTWNLHRDIFKDFSFRLLQQNSAESTVVSFDVQNKILELDTACLTPEMGGSNFELTSHEEAPVLGARLITQTGLNEAFPDLHLKLGSTKGTNALLENKGAKTLFIVTKGFADLLEIGNQARPDIFALNVQKPKQLTHRIIEVDERIDSNGKVLEPLDIESLKNQLAEIDFNEIESVALSLMNAYINPEHELQLTQVLKEQGFRFISPSTELSPLIKILNRAETAVVNAYLSPIIHNYVTRIAEKTGRNLFQIMTSAGGLVSADKFHPKDSLLSGPAGGVVGAREIGGKDGYTKLITFDMGGTSTDVSRIDGEFDYRYELQVGDARINSPAIAIETVAAGGGSICGFDGYKLFVGPESAGAYPGPACYGAGGPLTITDVNLLLNRLDASQFGIPVFKHEAEKRLEELLESMEKSTGDKPSADIVLNGFIAIANEIMAGAIRKISITKGYDPKDFALVAFGGAGGLHTCDIAEILGIQNILLPKDAGLLSAYGIGNASVERFAEKQVLQNLNEVGELLPDWFKEIETEASKKLQNEGFDKEKIGIRQRMVFMRFAGQDSSLEIHFSNLEQLVPDFHQHYKKVYGHTVSNRTIEIEAIRVLAAVENTDKETSTAAKTNYLPEPFKTTENGTPVFVRKVLKAGAQLKGPALFLDSFSTTFVKSGWSLELQHSGTAIIKSKAESQQLNTKQNRETELELFTNRFMAIAENMGALLQRTSLSVNIKERLDFSCALLDKDGLLVANAPHIPVHLGGLGVCVRELIKHFEFEEGDTIVTNHPKYGGSHLPDVTLVSPVFYAGERVGFVVNRAHHSEIGGISPGSMPPNAKNLEEEGVCITPFYLVKNGQPDWDGMQNIFLNGKYPTRSVEENLADLNAALAANKNGSEALIELINKHGKDTVQEYLDLLRGHAAQKMKATLQKFENGNYSATEYLDDGAKLQVNIQLNDGNCSIDFTGSADVHKGNMNATEAIVKSVSIYVLRLLLNETIPLNDGLLEPVDFILPSGLLNPNFDDDPSKCPAVVGGNVEISQRLTDTLLKAFGVVAASQGTMNNTLFGNKNFGYYETICGGCGAGNGFNGASAVHHHMTNTRITDPEIMEHRYPVQLVEFSIRKNSGGFGKWHGGDGVKRVLTFLEPVNLSVLTQRRKSGPFGLNGASDGKAGCQKVIRSNGEEIILDSIQNINMEQGDSFIIETPGGGGFGKE